MPQVNFRGAMTCVQCSEPKCQEVCPVGAIVKSQTDGVVRISEDKCIGCGICTVACPYGGIYLAPGENTAFKCDLCDGNPKCVQACPYHILDYLKNSITKSYLNEADLYSPGTGLCMGCPVELAFRFALKVLGENTVVFNAPGCAMFSITGWADMPGTHVACCSCLLDNVASCMTGVRRYYEHIGKEVNVVAFVGDGATADVGFQCLSGAAERQERLLYICYDNEGYMNTGIQRSSTTPVTAWTTTTPAGKMTPAKNVPLLMVFHKVTYVATATVAYLEDYAKKLTKAMQVKDGMAYIHLLTPCPAGWKFSPHRSIEISRLAVQTNYFPLWEARNGEIRLTHEVSRPKPIQEYTQLIGKYSHLNREDLGQLQQSVDENFSMLKKLTCDVY